MKTKLNPPTIADVAQKSGVSIATVSRVLNGTTPVIDETAERVRAAIAELNYAPRPAARGLARRRTDTIGLALPEIGGAFFSPMLRGIEAGVHEADFDLLIHSAGSTRPHKRPFRALGEHNTDGLIIFPDGMDEEEIRRLYGQGFPQVLMHLTPPHGLEIPMVTVENKSGAQALVEHLITVHACRRIAFLQGPDGQEDSQWRERGYREALQNHAIPFDPALLGKGDFNAEVACATLKTWLTQGLKFDAVFAGDDESASGAMQALRDAGIGIPEQVAVVGFDDISFAKYLNPPLTTVSAPTEQVGLEAVRQLTKLIRHGSCDLEVLLPTQLVIRQSCGCRKTEAPDQNKALA